MVLARSATSALQPLKASRSAFTFHLSFSMAGLTLSLILLVKMAGHLLPIPFLALPPPAIPTNTPLTPQHRLVRYSPIFYGSSSEDEEPPNRITHPQRGRSNSMASSSSRPEKVYHQDYIARIRYSNALPPPPGDPKLLNIPCDGLEYYTSAAFASRLARSQPLNIEPDGDLGMKIDLVGMPGIFDGDESCRPDSKHPSVG